MSNETKQVALRFPVRLDTDGNGFSYCEDMRFDGCSCYAKPAKAIDTLKAMIAMEIDVALDTHHHHRKTAIGTVAGPVFIVERAHKHWQYSIVGPDRAYAGSTMADWLSHDACVRDAIKHAEGAFGGVAWQSSF